MLLNLLFGNLGNGIATERETGKAHSIMNNSSGS